MFLLPLLNDSFIKQIQTYCQSLDMAIDNNYCMISLNKSTIIISIFIFINRNTNRICRMNFYAISSVQLFNLISQHNALNTYISLSHALYIGKEIHKIEMTNIFKQRYVQS